MTVSSGGEIPQNEARSALRCLHRERFVQQLTRGLAQGHGKAQHGQLNLQIASLGDSKSIAKARAGAEWFIKNQVNLLEYKRLNSEVARYQRITTLN